MKSKKRVISIEITRFAPPPGSNPGFSRTGKLGLDGFFVNLRRQLYDLIITNIQNLSITGRFGRALAGDIAGRPAQLKIISPGWPVQIYNLTSEKQIIN